MFVIYYYYSFCSLILSSFWLLFRIIIKKGPVCCSDSPPMSHLLFFQCQISLGVGGEKLRWNNDKMCFLIYRKSSYCRIAHINYSPLWNEEKEQKNTKKKKLKILYIQPCCGHTKSSLQYLLNSSWDLEGGILHPEQLSV